jgi:hypothetical protein
MPRGRKRGDDRWKRRLDVCLLAWSVWRARQADRGEGYGQTAYSRSLSGEARGYGYRGRDHAPPREVEVIDSGLAEIGIFHPEWMEALQFYLEHPNMSVEDQAKKLDIPGTEYLKRRTAAYEYLRGHVFRQERDPSQGLIRVANNFTGR